MTPGVSSKDRILDLIQANPFISQQELAARLDLTRSAVASHITQLIRDHRLLGRAYVLPTVEPVLVAGGANLDRIARSLGPVVMGTSNPVSLNETFGGVARNVAENLARMGLPVRLLTAVGDDAQGSLLLKHARDLGIDTGLSLVVNEGSTGTYTALLRPDGEMVIAMADMAVMEAWTLDALHDRRKLWASAKLRVVDLNLPGPLVKALIEGSRQEGVLLVVVAVSGPKMDRLPRSLEGVSVLILNADELGAWLGRPLLGPEAIKAACLEVLDQGAGGVVVTLGADGIICGSATRKPRHLRVPKTRVVDVTGAGDAFSAGVVAALASHPHDLVRACRIGQRLAALTLGCQSSVAPMLTPAFLQECEEAHPPSSRIGDSHARSPETDA
jgi:pseudouridine kinase